MELKLTGTSVTHYYEDVDSPEHVTYRREQGEGFSRWGVLLGGGWHTVMYGEEGLEAQHQAQSAETLRSPAEKAFRKLCEKWFNAHVAEEPHPREWESEEQMEAREARNAAKKQEFDEETERMIRGE